MYIALLIFFSRGIFQASGGVFSYLIGDGMTRGPVVRMASAREACLVREWIEEQDNFIILSEAFNQSSRLDFKDLFINVLI